MPKRRSKYNTSDRYGAMPVILLAVIAALVLVSRACSFPIDERLTKDPVGVVETLVGTLPVEIDLPTAAPTAGSGPAAPPREEGGLEAYFSNPLSDNNRAQNALVDAVGAARASIDMAIYNLTLDPLADALVNAHKRGVRVRIVMESEAMDKDVPRRLMDAGIPITGDRREGLMHNKFTIIDGEEVWTGSANYTSASFHDDFNNLLRIRSRQAAESYTANFEEMFSDHRFGPDKRPNTPYPDITVGGSEVEMYFSPDDGVARQVVDELRAAKQSVEILAYSFTRDDFANTLIAQSKAGVTVRGVFDQDQYEGNTGGEFDNLKAAGMDVRLDTLPGLLHDKVMIIDGHTVVTGSYNFSGNAERTNDENLVIVHDPAVARAYHDHFAIVWSATK